MLYGVYYYSSLSVVLVAGIIITMMQGFGSNNFEYRFKVVTGIVMVIIIVLWQARMIVICCQMRKKLKNSQKENDHRVRQYFFRYIEGEALPWGEILCDLAISPKIIATLDHDMHFLLFNNDRMAKHKLNYTTVKQCAQCFISMMKILVLR